MGEEERTGIRNIWLLFIALALGALVVVVYNVHIYNVRQAVRGQTSGLLRATRDIEANDKIGDSDLVVVSVPKQYVSNLGNVVLADDLHFAVGSTVNQPVQKGQYLAWSHITKPPTGPDTPVTPGKVGLGVALDSNKSPGDILTPNNRVNIVGRVAVGTTVKTYRIIEGVRVLAIGGEGSSSNPGDTRLARPAQRSRNYRNITVELSDDVSVEFTNVLSYVNGSPWVEVLPPGATNKNFGRINPLLKDLAAQPSKPLKAEDY